MRASMSKITAIFRCPLDDYREMETLSRTNNVDISRIILYSLLMYTDACEAEGIIPRELGSAGTSCGCPDATVEGACSTKDVDILHA